MHLSDKISTHMGTKLFGITTGNQTLNTYARCTNNIIIIQLNYQCLPVGKAYRQVFKIRIQQRQKYKMRENINNMVV